MPMTPHTQRIISTVSGDLVSLHRERHYHPYSPFLAYLAAEGMESYVKGSEPGDSLPS